MTDKKVTKKRPGRPKREKPVDTIKAPAPNNAHNVPDDVWAKWGDAGKGRFNSVYTQMCRSPSTFNAHPDAEAIPDEQWRVIAWNAAWSAASL